MAMLTTPTTIPVAFAGSDIDSASTIIPDGSRGAPLTFVKHRESAGTDVIGVLVSIPGRSGYDRTAAVLSEKRAVSAPNGGVTGDCFECFGGIANPFLAGVETETARYTTELSSTVDAVYL